MTPRLAITIGRGVKSDVGRRVELEDGTPAALLRVLESASPDDLEAWWTPAIFEGDDREKEKWLGAAFSVVDVDHHDATGEHAETPREAACAIVDAAVNLDLPGNLFHATPGGARLVFALSETMTERSAWVAAAKGACALVARALEKPGLTAFRVDPASFKPAQFYFMPKTTDEKGRRRDSKVLLLRDATYSPLELVTHAPPEPERKAPPGIGPDERIPHGERHNRMRAFSASLRARGMASGEILEALRGLNLRCDPPLPDVEFRSLAESAARLEIARPLTDLGNAELLVDHHGEDLRFAPGIGWLAWDGTRWRRDDDGEPHRRAAETARAIYDAAAKAEDKELRGKISEHARRSESNARLNAMVERAEKDRRIIVRPDSLDVDAWLLCVENGVIDLRTGRPRPHSRADLITKLAPVMYAPGATCPRFDRFLVEIMDGNERLVGFQDRLIGYSLTGSVREHVLPFLYGTGRNGKGTLVGTYQRLLGDYATAASSALLMGDRDEADPRSGVSQLRGVRFAAATEVGEGRSLNEALVKKVTGADRLRGSFLYRDAFEFDPTHKVWLQGNHKPVIRGTDPAIWSRVLLVPFTVSFEGREDRDLPEKLRSELPGILNRVIRGCLQWQEQGLNPPSEVRAATNQYRREMDRLLGFLESECVMDPRAFTPTPTLKKAYADWAAEAEETPLTWEAVIPRLKERGCRTDRATVGGKVTRGWWGIRLRTAEEHADLFAEEVRHA